jgi:hypothetical protein
VAGERRHREPKRSRPTGSAKRRADSAAHAEPYQQVLALQREAGNAAVSRMLASVRPAHPTLSRGGDGAAAAAAASAPATFKDKFTAAVDKKRVSLSTLRKLIAKASEAERKEVWSDSALTAKAEAKLSDKEYLKLLTDIGMSIGGSVAHKTPKEADDLIRDKLKDHVAKAVKANKQIAGQIAVVTGSDWEAAYKYEYGSIDDEEPTTNAFVATKLDRRVFVHADRGNPGTVIHEGMHKYSNLKIKNTFGSSLNEGVTEFFTRKITDELSIARSNYEDNYAAAKKMADTLTEDVVAKAYFDGDLDGLKKAFIDHRVSKGQTKAEAKQDWKDFVEAGDDWPTIEGFF